jgi:hypothetical protein
MLCSPLTLATDTGNFSGTDTDNFFLHRKHLDIKIMA